MNTPEFFKLMRTAEIIGPFALRRLEEKTETECEPIRDQVLLEELLVVRKPDDASTVRVTLAGIYLYRAVMGTVLAPVSAHISFIYRFRASRRPLLEGYNEVDIHGGLFLQACVLLDLDDQWERFTPAVHLHCFSTSVSGGVFGDNYFAFERMKEEAHLRYVRSPECSERRIKMFARSEQIGPKGGA